MTLKETLPPTSNISIAILVALQTSNVPAIFIISFNDEPGLEKN